MVEKRVALIMYHDTLAHTRGHNSHTARSINWRRRTNTRCEPCPLAGGHITQIERSSYVTHVAEIPTLPSVWALLAVTFGI